MGKDLGMDASDYALMSNFFLGAYAIGKLASGKLYDKIGTRLGFTVSIIIWSIASVLHAFSRGLVSLSIFKVLLGLGEAGNWPGAVKSNGEWFPVKERAIAQGIFNAGSSIGNVIAPFIIVFLFAQFGWKTTYIIIGSLGLLWVIPWLFLNKSTPEKHPWVTQEERDLINSNKSVTVLDTNKVIKSLSIPKILSYKQSWGVLLCRFFMEPAWWFFAIWLPIYLNNQFGLSIEQIANTMWISYLIAAIGSITGGWFSGMLMKSKSVNFSRKTTIALGGILMIIGFVSIVLFVNKENHMTFIYLAGLVLFGFQFAIGNIQTLSSDLFRGPSVGTLAGMAGMIASVSPIIMNWLFGKLSNSAYSSAFIAIAISVALGVLCVFLFIREIGFVVKSEQ